jgi:hypothetical protein
MNKKELPKKKQHWVPLFYLRNWATEETKYSEKPRGWILSKNKGEPIKVNLRNFAEKRYLYSPPDKDGKRSFETEDKLADYEAVISSIWSKISNDYFDFSKGTSIRKGIALFISLLYHRNPIKIKNIENTHSNLVKMYEEFPKTKNGNPLLTSIVHKGKEYLFDNSNYAEYKNSSKIDFQHMFVENIHRSAVPFAKLFMNKRWAIVFSENEHFITSDNPVVVENHYKDIFGINTEGTMITFPLSPQRILIMDDLYEEGDGKYYPLKDNNPVPFNFTFWRNAKEFMLSKRHPNIVCEEIVNDADGYI